MLTLLIAALLFKTLWSEKYGLSKINLFLNAISKTS
jgi:hypothetical protein